MYKDIDLNAVKSMFYVDPTSRSGLRRENKSMRSDNTSGVTGVCWRVKKLGKTYAEAKVEGERKG